LIGVRVAERVEESLRSQAVSGVLWNVLQKWSVRLSTFVGFLLLGRLLTPEDFGVVAVAMAFVVLLTVLADAGFATYLVQVRELTEEAKNTAFWIATAAGIVLAGALTGLAGLLAQLFDVAALTSVVPALSLALVFVGLSSVPAALLTREMRFQQLAVRQVTATVVSVVVAVALAVSGAGVWALVAQTLVRQVVASAVLLRASEFRPRLAFDVPEARRMTSYSGKAMGAQLLSQGREQAEVLLIGAFAGPVALGLWTVASRLVNVLTDVLGTAIGSVAVPLFARVQTEPERLGRAVSATAAIGSLVLAPALGALALLSPEAVTDVFGEQWAGAATVASLLAVRGLLVALAGLDRSVLLNAGRAGGELAVITALVLVHVVVVAAVAPHGIEVLAAVVLLEAALVAPVRPVLMHRWLGVPYGTWTGVSRVLLAAVLAGAATWGVLHGLGVAGSGSYVVVGAVGGLAYAGLVLLLARSVVTEAHSAVVMARRTRRPVSSPAAAVTG
jgi:O-antigen/teichoic acid export membrane protein